VWPTDTPILLSSEGNELGTVPHINVALEALKHRLVGVELDGELYCHGMPHETIHGVISSQRKELHPQFEDIKLHLFDIIREDLPQCERLVRLQGLKPWLQDSGCFEIAPYTMCNSFREVMDTLDWSINQGFEGIIVRHLEALYLRRRSVYMMKFKPRKEDLYQIVGYEEEVSQYGEPKNALGALICRAHDSEELFNVGSGFTASQRAEMWRNKEDLKGELVRVKYQHLTSGRGVPRSGVYAGLAIEILEGRDGN
jgi:DNA ligase 1